MTMMISARNAARTKNLKIAILLAVLNIFPVTEMRADQGDRLNALLNSMPVVYQDAQVEIRSDAKLNNITGLAAHFADAYNYDRQILGLNAVPALNKRVFVGLPTERTIAQFMTSAMGGRAFGNDSFISHANFYSERPDLAWFITAHELEHLQMHRLRANEPEVPVYIFEGIACSVGDRYTFSKFGDSKYLRTAAQRLAGVSGADATDVIRNFRSSDSISQFKLRNRLWEGEHIGGLFIEFLQSRFPNGRFFQAFGLICQDVSAGKTFPASFQKRLGISLGDAEEEFIAHMKRTEDSSNERFAGTVYSQLR